MENAIRLNSLQDCNDGIPLISEYRGLGKKENGKPGMDTILFSSTVILKREVCSDLNKFILELMMKIKEEASLNHGTIEGLTVCAVSRCDYVKAELDIKRDKVIFNKKIKDAAETVKLVVNTETNIRYLRFIRIFEYALHSCCEKSSFEIEAQKTKLFKSNQLRNEISSPDGI